MAKPNKRHHENCLRYKQEGRHERNKKIRAERNERRIARFAARSAKKENISLGYESKDPETRGDNLMPSYKGSAFKPRQRSCYRDGQYSPTKKGMTEYAAFKSLLKRAQNQLDAATREEKQSHMDKKKGGKKSV